MLPDLLLLVFHLAKKSALILIFLFPVVAFSQSKKHGSIKVLKANNGFNGITLGANVNQLTGSLAYLDGNSRVDADSCLRYVYTNEELLKIDTNLKLDGIGLRAYKDTIVNIYLFFRMEEAYKVMSKFLDSYGQFNEKPLEYSDIYNWNTIPINLSLNYSSRMDMGIAVFTNNLLMKEVTTAREKRDQRAIRVAAAQARANRTRDSAECVRRVILHKVLLERIHLYY